jgi:taurine--2-oxoglutarate transaminase
MTTADLKDLDRRHVIYSWKAQGSVDPIMIDRAEGIYMWDTDGQAVLRGPELRHRAQGPPG